MIGTATDPYQPAERRFRVTRGILEVLAEQEGIGVTIITKSPLVTRDIDLLQKINARSRLSVHVSLITADRELARCLEPRAPPPEARLRGIGCCPGRHRQPEPFRLLVFVMRRRPASCLNATVRDVKYTDIDVRSADFAEIRGVGPIFPSAERLKYDRGGSDRGDRLSRGPAKFMHSSHDARDKDPLVGGPGRDLRRRRPKRSRPVDEVRNVGLQCDESAYSAISAKTFEVHSTPSRGLTRSGR